MPLTDHYLHPNYPESHQESKAGSKPLERPEPLVKVQELAYLLFQRPDLEKQRGFLEDFGMRLAGEESGAMYFRGHGSSPWFYATLQGDKPRYLGAGYTVESAEQLTEIAARHAVDIEAVDGPGGGKRVRLRDPDGFIADFVHAREPAERFETREALFDRNTPGLKSRVNHGVRSQPEPSPLEKAGHFVQTVTDFQRSARWYMENLGLIPTDVLCVEDGTPVLAFMRCDRGATPADHHTVVLMQHFAPGLMHSAYETFDLDAVGQGSQYLTWKGWKHYWGIGRHILGSQIFDYWLDPYGVEMEHYADGDVFTADQPTNYHLMDRGGLWTWGDDLPPSPTPGVFIILKLILTGQAKKLPPVLGKMRGALAGKPRPWLK
jgi:hypothetical protein